jgi:hypothetical protein
LNSQNKIVYEAKLPPMREVRAIIGESLWWKNFLIQMIYKIFMT